MSDVHPAALRGFSEGAATYQRGRPDYPQELIPWAQRELGLGAAAYAVDLGAGTGKFTKILVATGARVLAVEPVEAMRGKLGAALPAVSSVAGSAQEIPVADESIDAVACAQSFHWFATLESLREIHRVLRPGGKLGLVWNVRNESVDWVAAVTRIIEPYEGDTPRFHSGDWRRPFDGTLFTDLSETRFDYRHVGATQEVIVDRCMSVSFIAALDHRKRAGISERLEALIATHPSLRDRGTVEMPYQTRAFHCTRR